MKRLSHRACLLVLIAAPLASCASDPMPSLQAVAWASSAAEHEALCRQTFVAALASVQAQHEQRAAEGRPDAVIVDVDETVLDNAPYQANLARTGSVWTAESWRAWVQAGAAIAMPGAVEFAKACAAMDVTVFYVTNRVKGEEEAKTRENLLRCGFPVLSQPDGVLCLGEIDVGSDKSKRREHVAASHRVLAWIGDDLGDFVLPAATTPERDRQVEQYADKWGTVWFLLPNAMYGSWLRAVEQTTGKQGVAALRSSLEATR